ncbi:hypothetical protein C0992_000919 [Termitomyces sp. T32_za158]|nr:hypothetical protein C0992_000919 [Termitomyces sp. T32_za158]
MFYTRGSSSDFDRYAEVTGDSGWSWKNLQPYIRKVNCISNERWTAPADNHNTSGQFDPKVHGFEGINSVSLAGYPQSIDPRIIQTMKDLPDEFPFNLDMNSGDSLGLGRTQASFGVYLVALYGHSCKRLVASKEVILSAGVVGTPQLLLNSGIGESSELRSVGVEPLLHLPDVGKNFSDQPVVLVSWFVKSASNDNIYNAGIMTSEYDRVALRESVKKSIRFVSAPAWKDYVIRPGGGLENVTTDDDLDKFILDSVSPGMHGVGTAAMSAKGAVHGVVDPDLRLKGASGLRVVDASVMKRRQLRKIVFQSAIAYQTAGEKAHVHEAASILEKIYIIQLKV